MTLAYAIAYPKRVKAMIAWGIYLGRQSETDFVSAGHPRYNYPEAWERFIELVPKEHQKDGTSITRYYAEKLDSKNEDEARKYADEWTLWEASLLSISYDKAKLEQAVLGDETNIPLAKLETLYFLNQCYLPENYILRNINVIKDIPLRVIQGRFDNCTPPITAYELSKVYGKNMSLQIVNAGHKRNDPELQSALRATINTTFV